MRGRDFRGFSFAVVPPPLEQMLYMHMQRYLEGSKQQMLYQRYLFFSQVKRRDVPLGTEQVGCVNYVFHGKVRQVWINIDSSWVMWMFR